MTEANGIAALTGACGAHAGRAFTVNLQGSSGKVQNNASILFEVTGKSYDEASGLGTITLSATSHVLSADGTTSEISKSKITISKLHNSVKLGSLLGEDDDHFTLTLSDRFDIDDFEAGHKFVYSICGTGNPKGSTADTSLFINGRLDETWPLSWNKNFYLNSENGRV